jgi:hypothetical protein
MRGLRGRRRLIAPLVAIALALVMLPGCNWIEGKDYYLTGGNGVYVNFREPTTRAMNTYLLPGCKFDRHCVANWLRNNVNIGGFAGNYWRTALSYENDMWLHALAPSYNNHSRCPTIHIDLTNDINWETHGCSW